MIFKNRTDEFIQRLAKVGSIVSRNCRNGWTGEQTAVSVQIDRLAFGGRNDIAYLEALGLLALEDIADLFQARLLKYGQHSWKQGQWERAIRERIKQCP